MRGSILRRVVIPVLASVLAAVVILYCVSYQKDVAQWEEGMAVLPLVVVWCPSAGDRLFLFDRETNHPRWSCPQFTLMVTPPPPGLLDVQPKLRNGFLVLGWKLRESVPPRPGGTGVACYQSEATVICPALKTDTKAVKSRWLPCAASLRAWYRRVFCLLIFAHIFAHILLNVIPCPPFFRCAAVL